MDSHLTPVFPSSRPHSAVALLGNFSISLWNQGAALVIFITALLPAFFGNL
jgi:hypothetical protein